MHEKPVEVIVGGKDPGALPLPPDPYVADDSFVDRLINLFVRVVGHNVAPCQFCLGSCVGRLNSVEGTYSRATSAAMYSTAYCLTPSLGKTFSSWVVNDFVTICKRWPALP